ncbi:Probable histone acetyltransferase HAC-like 1 [Seminavis robusta]|uniref:histone acetyltransferase n=1 Tax=Seminavis robusta TaxID=568900 RepID=A0A9N8HLT5_9STRA|nr:Probable histone acetyltransferase HAC-like 1 [Seminavis robusta]|eukprot:Sro851_g210860.1 Probable histone acetyltransferase HAC-like 1 (1735) ;mRNA; r:14284-20220
MMYNDPMGNPQQHPGGVTAPPMPPPPMGPGHQTAPSPVMPPQHHHQQPMNPPFPHPQRRHSSGMPGQFAPHGMPPQSPAGGRQPSFGNMPGGHQPYGSHPPMQSPATQQQPGHMQGMHPNLGRRQSNSMPGSHSHQQMGMPMPGPQHDSMRPPSNSHQQQFRQNVNPMNSNMGSHNSMGNPNNSGSMNSSGWQSEKDTPHRREMIQHIVKLLKKDKNGSPESLNKLPQMAKQLEVSLYRNARSFEAYMDPNTLKARLQQIAVEVSRKAPGRMRSSQSGDNRDDRHWTERQQQQQNQFSNGRRPQDNNQLQRGSSSSSPYMGNSGSTHQQMQRGGVVNMDDINPIAGSGGGTRGHSSSSNNYSSSRQGSSDQNRGGGSSSGSVPHNRNDPEWKIRIRHKQQRLLLLHHSAKCPHDDGRCTVTPHCADMKRLWRHMEGCKDNNCRVSHCFSSRAILSHYRKCKDPNCPACGPVRDTVKKSSQNRTPSQGSSRSNRGPSSQPMMGNNLMNLGGNSIGGNAMSTAMNGPIGGSSMGGGNSMGIGGGPPLGNSMTTNQMGGNSLSQMNNPIGGNMGNMGGSLQRGMSGPQPGQNSGMMQGNDNLNPTHPGGNFNSGSSSLNNYQQQSSRSNMPPPGSNSGGMPFNPSSNSQSGQRYRSGSNAGNPAAAVQPLFQSDRPSASSRGGSSSSRTESNNPMNDSTMNPASLSSTGGGSGSGAGSGGGGSSGGSSRKNDSEWQKVRHKQQRLLLLRHASRCQYEAGKCPVTPHCASMKDLWKHIAHCKDQQCSVQHCMSSRYVLSHYRRCKDAKCPACGPVRETIRKSHEKEKNRQPNASFDIDVSSHSKSQRTANMPSSSSAKKEQVPPQPTSSGPNAATSAPMSSPPQSYEPEPKRGKTARTSDREMASTNAAAPLAPQSNDPVSSAPNVPSSSSAPKEPAPARPTPKPQKPISLPPVKKETPAPKVKAEAPASAPKPAPAKNIDRSLLKSFTTQELEVHLASLNRQTQLPPSKLKAKCLEVLKGLQTHQHGWVFNVPVDPVELGLPDYFDIIKKPMDLGTIHKKLDAGNYHDIDNFQADTNLTFDNAMTYNEEGSVVYDMAKELKAQFEIDFKKLMSVLEAEDKERRQNERACTLCGCEKLLFEPPVFFCNGMNCQSTRIRRNSHFYVGGNNQYFWCNQCFNELDEKIPIELVDMTITKGDLKKKKNDEVHEESWVQCDCCERWVHQICGLFNTRQNKEHHSEYFCPQCLLDKHKAGKATAQPRPMGAADLPRTILSEWLEQHITKRVDQRKRELAEDKSNTENIPLVDALKYIESGGPITIRQVTAMDRKLEVRELMKKRYAHKKYPDEFPFRCKCIVVFQHLDGVDVVLFALRRGFATAHIWACPPLKGDDYIFYAKPEDQKTPRDSRLRQWYIDMLVDCQKRDIVGKVTNMYDLYFANEALDATAVPYLEGDYFPGEAENIIKMIEEGGGKKSGSGGKKSKKKSTSKQRSGTRSTGVDEEALLASGMLDAKNLSELDRDQVMVKLGETIQPMKESFIVAFLNWSGAKPEDMEVPDDIAKFRKENAGMQEPKLSGSKRDSVGEQVKDKAIDKSGNPVKVIDDDGEDLDSQQDDGKSGGSNLTEEQRQQRQKNLMLHIQLIEHASRCKNQQCSSSNCAKMKNYLQHARLCKIKVQGGCKICKRIWTLLRIHAQKCKESVCPIPQCMAIREKMRQLQRQQQAMDDRRRLEMNRHRMSSLHA